MEMNSHPQELDAGGRRRNRIAIALLVVVLLGLPIAVWLDVQSLTHAILARQADELNSMITIFVSLLAIAAVLVSRKSQSADISTQ